MSQELSQIGPDITGAQTHQEALTRSGYTRIGNTGDTIGVDRFVATLGNSEKGKKQVDAVDRLVSQALTDAQLNTAISTKIEADPRLKALANKNAAKKLATIEAIQDVIENFAYYKGEKPSDQFLLFWVKKSSGQGAADLPSNIITAEILEYLTIQESDKLQVDTTWHPDRPNQQELHAQETLIGERKVHKKILHQLGVFESRPPITSDDENLAVIAPQPDQHNGQPIPAPTPSQEPVTSLDLGIVSIDEIVQSAAQQAEFLMARSLTREPPNLKLIRRAGTGIRNAWQKTIMRDLFKQRWMRFSVEMTKIAKQTADMDKSMHLEISNDLFQTALTEAHEIIQHSNPIQQLIYRIIDIPSGLTSIGRSTEMRLAKKWLKENATTVMQPIIEKSIAEQDALGDKYAMRAHRLTDQQVNDQILSPELGEKRQKLEKLFVRRPQELIDIKNRLRSILTEYKSGAIRDKKSLIIAMNRFVQNQIMDQLSPDQQKEFGGLELASNIVKLAEMVKNPANANLDIDNVELNIYLGKGEWGGKRGKIDMGAIERRMVERLVERNFRLRDTITAGGVGQAAKYIKDFGKDALIYGGAYAITMANSGFIMSRGAILKGILGPLSLTPIVGTTITAILATLKEDGFVIPFVGGAELYGKKGNYLREFAQLSRETAGGRASPELAKVRKELERALVNSQSAVVLTTAINEVLSNSNLTADEKNRQLLKVVAHAKARLKMTDMSSLGGGLKLNIAQNFITFDEGQENEQLTALRHAVLKGVETLAPMANYENELTSAELFMQANLRVGTTKEKIITTLKAHYKNQLPTGRSAQDIVNQYFDQLENTFHIDKGKSLEGAMTTLRKLNGKRALKTFARTMIISPLAGMVGQTLISEGQHLFGFGLQEYQDAWSHFLAGAPKLKLDAANHAVSDLTFLQKGVLLVRNIIEKPFPSETHEAVIQGIQVKLPGSLIHEIKTINGVNHEVLLNIQNGNVTDISDFKLHLDSGGNLVVTDVNGNPGNAAFNKLMRDTGTKISEISHKINPLTVKPSMQQDITIGGNTIQTTVPTGTVVDNNGASHDWVGHWEHNQNNDTWNIVGVDNTGKAVLDHSGNNLVLATGIKIDSQGNIVSHGVTSTNTTISASSIPGSGTGGHVLNQNGEIVKGSEWDTQKTVVAGRQWYGNNTPKSDLNELTAYDKNLGGGKVEIDISKMKANWSFQDGNTPRSIDVQDLIKNPSGHTLGAYFTIPGHPNEGILLPFTNGKLVLDPNSSDLKIAAASKMILNQQAMAGYDQASQLTNHQDIYNVKYWEIVDKTPDNHINVLATGLGSGVNPIIPITTPTIDVTLPSAGQITEHGLNFTGPDLHINIPTAALVWRQDMERSITAQQAQQNQQTNTTIQTPTQTQQSRTGESNNLTQEATRTPGLVDSIIDRNKKLTPESIRFFDKNFVPALKEFEEAKRSRNKARIDAAMANLKKKTAEIILEINGNTTKQKLRRLIQLKGKEKDLKIGDPFTGGSEQVPATAAKIIQEYMDLEADLETTDGMEFTNIYLSAKENLKIALSKAIIAAVQSGADPAVFTNAWGVTIASVNNIPAAQEALILKKAKEEVIEAMAKNKIKGEAIQTDDKVIFDKIQPILTDNNITLEQLKEFFNKKATLSPNQQAILNTFTSGELARFEELLTDFTRRVNEEKIASGAQAVKRINEIERREKAKVESTIQNNTAELSDEDRELLEEYKQHKSGSERQLDAGLQAVRDGRISVEDFTRQWGEAPTAINTDEMRRKVIINDVIATAGRFFIENVLSDQDKALLDKIRDYKNAHPEISDEIVLFKLVKTKKIPEIKEKEAKEYQKIRREIEEFKEDYKILIPKFEEAIARGT